MDGDGHPLGRRGLESQLGKLTPFGFSSLFSFQRLFDISRLPRLYPLPPSQVAFHIRILAFIPKTVGSPSRLKANKMK